MEAMLSLRRILVLCLLLGLLILGWLSWRDAPSRRQAQGNGRADHLQAAGQFREAARLIRPARRPICRR